MIFSAAAERQIDELQNHYERLGRVEAVIGLERAIKTISDLMDEPTRRERSSPGPYPELARPGRAWLKAGRYWFYTTTQPPRIVLAVFFETADIPGRFGR